MDLGEKNLDISDCFGADPNKNQILVNLNVLS